MREMKDSGIEWIGMIPKDWKINLLSSFFTEHKMKNKDLKEQNLLSLSYGRIINKSIDTKEGLLPESFDGYNVINPGDIVFRLTDLQNDKRSLRTGICKERGIITSAYITIRNRVPLNQTFYHYLFHSYDIRKVFYGMGDGVRQGMNYNDLRKLPIVAPSLIEQTRIATFLDEKCKDIDTLIALQEEMIAELQAYKQSVISEAVTKGLNPNVPMKDSGVEWIGEIPLGWEIRKMKNLCSFINGDRSNNYPSPEDFTDNGIPFCGADSLNKIHVDVENVRHISIMKYNQMGGLKINYGDILYTLRGSTIGKNAIALFDNGTVASSLMGIRANNQVINNKFLVFWLNSKLERFQREICINGSTAPNLSAANVGEFIIPLPPLSEQQAIADYLDTKCAQIDELIALKQQKITELQDYKKSLIYEYVTGKKEVPANN